MNSYGAKRNCGPILVGVDAGDQLHFVRSEEPLGENTTCRISTEQSVIPTAGADYQTMRFGIRRSTERLAISMVGRACLTTKSEQTAKYNALSPILSAVNGLPDCEFRESGRLYRTVSHPGGWSGLPDYEVQ